MCNYKVIALKRSWYKQSNLDIWKTPFTNWVAIIWSIVMSIMIYVHLLLWCHYNDFCMHFHIYTIGFIKTHGSVLCGPRSRHATPVDILTGRTIKWFSCICNIVLLVQNQMIFAVEMPSTVSTTHSKFQLSRPRCFWDMNFQKLA